ncbi:LysR family transcriptional regulator, partial [Vibrio vulnificus]
MLTEHHLSQTDEWVKINVSAAHKMAPNEMTMDLNLLKTFDVVMKTRSVNEAA